MKLQVPYGERGSLAVSLPDENVAGVVRPRAARRQDPAELLRSALATPLESPPLEEVLRAAEDVLVIVNDGTRPTPTAMVLDVLHDQMGGRDFRVLVATGVHRPPSSDELRRILGRHFDDLKARTEVHDCDRSEDMVYIGTSRHGTGMSLNRRAVEAGVLILIGSVEPHYFGGFTGGRKMLLPGVASRDTIVQNHKLALRPGAASLALEGNPVHEDMLDAVAALDGKKIFSIQTVVAGDGALHAAACGDVHGSFLAAADKARELFCVAVPGKADIVLSVASYPMDVDFLQSQKALDNGARALRRGGILILVSECRGGIGRSDFFELLARCERPEHVAEELKKGYKLGYHTAARIAADIAGWAEIRAMTALDDRDVESAFMHPVHDLQQALDDALARKGKDARVLFLMDGSLTVPVV